MRISRDTVIYAFDKKAEPRLTIQTPCSLTVETWDCFHGQITSADQRLDSLDFNRVNPATGPLLVEGAMPGDVLKVEIHGIRLAEQGVMITVPGEGLQANSIKGKTLLCPIETEGVRFKDVLLPLAPMIGVIGVAPAGEPVPCGTPGNHGGNMDTSGIKPGSILYLPVFVPGALFALGDLHAAMGDGEVSVSGVEVAGEVHMHIEVEKGKHLPCPLLNTGMELAFVSSAQTTDEALQQSMQHMHRLLIQQGNLDADEALMLMGATGQARISQVVDPLKTARFCMPLPVLEQFGIQA